MVFRKGRSDCCAAKPRALRARRGLTLIELLVVAAVLVVLLSVLVPVISGARDTARRAQTAVLINTVSTATSQFREHNRRLPGVFTQEELASPSNLTGFTQMENAILDLAGGVDPTADVGGPNVFEVSLNNKSVRVNTRMIASTGGPGYLPLVLKGMESAVPEANGLAPARPEIDQIVDRSRGTAGVLAMPDILDAWGHPVLMWAKNEYAGERPHFSRLTSESEESPRRARFYWATNQGYLASRSQIMSSAIGAGIDAEKRQRSLDALLGDPANPDPGSGGEGGIFLPLSSRGDFLLHTAGRDGEYLSNFGEVRLEYRYAPGGLNIQAGAGGSLDRYWRTTQGLDDMLLGGN
ncbi:MAG: prepilin-type N-terminal cleavage/methylation domain-containing protein [Phycisphaerae bacterium]|nr:prepilin-type N-terminal cleavage/methylation domain-containing protein [Phycisphaerae bacterium]